MLKSMHAHTDAHSYLETYVTEVDTQKGRRKLTFERTDLMAQQHGTEPERDDITGTETTGHQWDGIKELNTPLPRWWCCPPSRACRRRARGRD